MAITVDTTSLPGKTIVTDSAGGVAIDYTADLQAIATALNQISNALTVSDSTKLADIIQTYLIESQSKASAVEILNLISTYRFLIESKDILKDVEEVSEKEQDKMNKRLTDYIRKIKILLEQIN